MFSDDDATFSRKNICVKLKIIEKILIKMRLKILSLAPMVRKIKTC